MKRSEFREVIKEVVLDLFENDDEFRSMVTEVVREQTGALLEAAPQVPKEPTDPELYDKLMLIAQGKTQGFKYKGKRVSAPNHGNGYKSGKLIKEWTEKVYTKVGGGWHRPTTKQKNPNNIAALQNLMGGLGMGATNANIIGNLDDDNALRAEMEAAGLGTSRTSLDQESGAVDVMDLLVDTAKTTLVEQETKGSIGPVADASAMTVATSNPEDIFGDGAVDGTWANMAFDN